jgi:hypothetical protein
MRIINLTPHALHIRRVDGSDIEVLTATNPHPPVIVERWVGGMWPTGYWVEKRLEWDGTKYREVEKC